MYVWQWDYGEYFQTDFVLHLFTYQDQALEEIYTPCGLNSYEFVYLPPESSGCLSEVVSSGTYEVSCGCADEAACNYSGDSNFYREQCFYLDDCAVCGGSGIAEGTCDCDGNILDECGICGGSGIAEGQCDCEGNVLDALDVCGGSCLEDDDDNGVCDDLYGCTYPLAENQLYCDPRRRASSLARGGEHQRL